ncbi:MAG: PBP1A family penicillin-binding protein [Pseudobacteriovorax sp.]|nr:PBP1A family penicillin-binding protein [Pseudobacteriovorax sp.]
MTYEDRANKNQDPLVDPIGSQINRPRRVWLWLIGICSVLGLSGAGYVSFKWLDKIDFFALNDDMLQSIVTYESPDNSIVFDRNGEKFGEFYSTHYVYTPLEDIPRDLVRAVIAVEDRRFFSHSGIDVRAMFRAGLQYIKTRRLRQGASTLTQQLVRNFLLTREKTMARKVKEIYLALRLERKLSKQRILEIYLNSLFLGNGSYGVAAAAQRYFGKPLSEINSAESALIAGLFQSPSRYNPQRFPKKAKKRQKQVIRAMVASKKVSARKAKKMLNTKLVYTGYNSINTQIAPYFIDYVREQAKNLIQKKIKNTGLRIHTTLDREIQMAAQTTIHKSAHALDRARAYIEESRLSKDNRLEASLLVTQPQTGEILAMVGGRDYNHSQFNRAVQARRSPGSAFKPVIYSLALEQGYKWSDMFYISPVAVDDYRPKNYSSDSYLQEATLLKAFYKSINTTVIELGQDLGMEEVLNHAKKLGILSTLKDEIGTMLGASEVTMLDMARMYSIFANKGVLVEPIAITKITDREGQVLYEAPPASERETKVVSEQIAYLMLEGLRSVMRYGTGYAFRNISHFAIGKTGTSNDAKDNWFCGITPETTAILWAGLDGNIGFEGSSVSAVKLALPIWANFAKRIEKLHQTLDFEAPKKIKSHKVHPNFGSLDNAGVTMHFLEGLEPKKTDTNLKAISLSGKFREIFER